MFTEANTTPKELSEKKIHKHQKELDKQKARSQTERSRETHNAFSEF
jgi:hypothetical protein